MGHDTVQKPQGGISAEQIAHALRLAPQFPNHPLLLDLSQRLAAVLNKRGPGRPPKVR